MFGHSELKFTNVQMLKFHICLRSSCICKFLRPSVSVFFLSKHSVALLRFSLRLEIATISKITCSTHTCSHAGSNYTTFSSLKGAVKHITASSYTFFNPFASFQQ